MRAVLLDADFAALDAQYQHVLLHYPGQTVIIGVDLTVVCSLTPPHTPAVEVLVVI